MSELLEYIVIFLDGYNNSSSVVKVGSVAVLFGFLMIALLMIKKRVEARRERKAIQEAIEKDRQAREARDQAQMAQARKTFDDFLRDNQQSLIIICLFSSMLFGCNQANIENSAPPISTPIDSVEKVTVDSSLVEHSRMEKERFTVMLHGNRIGLR